MTTLAVATDGLPIYDAAGLPLFQTPTGGVIDAAGNAADINPANGLPRDATGNDIQLALPSAICDQCCGLIKRCLPPGI
jgi:hypothetical protein